MNTPPFDMLLRYSLRNAASVETSTRSLRRSRDTAPPLRAVSTRRPPPAELLRVILRLTYLEEDLGLTSETMDQFEPDLYILTGSQLYLPGRWQIDVVARRKGIEDSVARFEWVVPQGAPEQKPIISDVPWEPLLTVMAAILLGVWVTAVFWGINRES